MFSSNHLLLFFLFHFPDRGSYCRLAYKKSLTSLLSRLLVFSFRRKSETRFYHFWPRYTFHKQNIIILLEVLFAASARYPRVAQTCSPTSLPFVNPPPTPWPLSCFLYAAQPAQAVNASHFRAFPPIPELSLSPPLSPRTPFPTHSLLSPLSPSGCDLGGQRRDREFSASR